MTALAGPPRRRRRTGALALLLPLLCAVAYAGVAGNGFLTHDDSSFVTGNPLVRGGLSLEGIRRYALTGASGNWVPLSFLSHTLDVSLFGLDAGRHHLVSLLLHAASAALLFLVLGSYTGATWRSFAAAALFAVHPLHVESVAWIAERRDVLSALFFFLTLAAYRRHVRRPGPWTYGGTCLAFLLGLLAKPMLVTLPLVLLLLDFWPLRRLGPGVPGTGRVLLEKLPLAALAAADGVITVVVQARDGAVAELGALPLGLRLPNAVAAPAAYLRKMLWPSDLAIFYPHPEGRVAATAVVLGAVLLLGLTATLYVRRKKAPFGLMGWLWYLGMLAPVVGILQVGKQAMADHYTYLPLVGIYIALCWTLGVAWEKIGRVRIPAAAAGVVLLGILVALTRRQVGTWRDDRSVFEHAARVTEGNALAAMKLGALRLRAGEAREAVALLREAAQLDPRDDQVRVILGVAWRELGEGDAAAREFREALRLNPSNSEALNNLGEILTSLGRPSEAMALLDRGIAVDPERPELHYNRANALGALGRRREAMEAYRRALGLRPGYGLALNNLGAEYQAQGMGREAEEAYLAAIESEPGLADPRYNLGLLYLGRGDAARARAQHRALAALDPAAAAELGRLLPPSP